MATAEFSADSLDIDEEIRGELDPHILERLQCIARQMGGKLNVSFRRQLPPSKRHEPVVISVGAEECEADQFGGTARGPVWE